MKELWKDFCLFMAEGWEMNPLLPIFFVVLILMIAGMVVLLFTVVFVPMVIVTIAISIIAGGVYAIVRQGQKYENEDN